MVAHSSRRRSLPSLRKLRIRGKNNRPFLLVGKPSKQPYLRIQNEEVLQRGHERALVAGKQMQLRAEKALLNKIINLNEYLRVRKAIEAKERGLLRRIKSQSKRLSERDPKFGMLYTPKKSRELADQLLRQKGPSSFVMVDVDHFKRINDAFGHDVGDVALRLIATVANRVARSMGGFAGRFGGEEFLIGLPTDKRAATDFVVRLNRELVREFNRSETVRSALRGELFTLSAGVVVKGERENFDGLFKLVDERLYAAKHQGRNRLVSDGRQGKVIRRN